MPWSDIATEEPVDRANRLIAAAVGALNPTGEDASEVFGTELQTVFDELNWDSEGLVRLVGCITAAAAFAMSELARRTLGISGEPSKTLEDKAAEQALTVEFLDGILTVIRTLAG